MPVLSALSQAPGQIDPQAAMAFFLVGAVHLALMVMVLKVAGTMVAGWQVFGLAVPAGDSEAGESAKAMASNSQRQPDPRYAAASAGAPRRIGVAAATAAATNDVGSSSGSSRLRETRVYATQGSSASPVTTAKPSRARGIGNRFRPLQSRALARKPEMQS